MRTLSTKRTPPVPGWGLAGVAALLALSVLAGCGSSAADREPPRSPGGYGGKETPAATGVAEDRDHDRVMDGADMEAEAPMKDGEVARGPELAAPAPAPPPPPPAGTPQQAPVKDTAKAPEATVQPEERAFVIYTADITMAVYQVEQGILAVEKIGKDNGGFLAHKGDHAITIRVPRGRFEQALAAIDKVGDVIHRDVQAQDVTDEYVDLEIRIKNARAMRARLQALLERANVKEAIEIEKELHRVTEQLERLEGKLKLLKDKIAYSTITVTFNARGATVQAGKIRLPFPWLSQLGLPQLLRLDEVK